MKHKNDTTINLLAFDTSVKFGDPSQATYIGYIMSARISPYTVMYEIKYWKDCLLNTIMLLPEDFQVIDRNVNTMKVGFVNPEKEKVNEEEA